MVGGLRGTSHIIMAMAIAIVIFSCVFRKIVHARTSVLLYKMALVPFDSPLHHDHVQILLAASAMLLLVVGVLALALSEVKKPSLDALGPLANFCRFFYASFLKPHTRDSTGSGQQAALESFYEAQVKATL